MWSLLRRLWCRVPAADQRGLFRFYDGRRWQNADPLSVARALFTDPEFDWDETPLLLQTGQAVVQLQAVATIARAVRLAFGLTPFADEGLSELECLELLEEFRRYLGDVKKNGSLFPISPDCMELPSAIGSPTKDASACGSMPAGPLSGPPGSPAEPIRSH